MEERSSCEGRARPSDHAVGWPMVSSIVPIPSTRHHRAATASERVAGKGRTNSVMHGLCQIYGFVYRHIRPICTAGQAPAKYGDVLSCNNLAMVAGLSYSEQVKRPHHDRSQRSRPVSDHRRPSAVSRGAAQRRTDGLSRCRHGRGALDRRGAGSPRPAKTVRPRAARSQHARRAWFRGSAAAPHPPSAPAGGHRLGP